MLVSSVCIMEEVNNFLQVKLMKKEKKNPSQSKRKLWSKRGCNMLVLSKMNVSYSIKTQYINVVL